MFPPFRSNHRGLLGGRARLLVLVGSCVGLLLWQAGALPGAVVTLKNGMQFEGRVAELASLNENPLNPASEDVPQLIIIIDDDLRRTFVPNLYVSSFGESPPLAQERIRIRQQVADSGRRIGSVGPILEVTPFDPWGRRTFSMQGPHGPIDVIQGITEVTPRYAKVEGLRTQNGYVWDMRLATSSIPRDTLTPILRREIDPKNANDRLRIVQLYIQAERYGDALLELDEAMKDFPDLAHLAEQADRLRQTLAQSLLREIELRQEAGQHERVYALLNNFPEKGIAGVTLLAVRDMLAEYEQRQRQYKQALELLDQQVALIGDGPAKEKLQPMQVEIQGELSAHSLDRMADFLRLGDDASLKPDQKVALAISGWLLGSGAAVDNLPVAMSLFELREQTRQYLNAARPHERDECLERMRSLEGGTPDLLAKIIAHMKPPLETTATELDTPGLFELTVPGIEEQADFSYYVQVPPEYNPYRRYPCIVTLNGAGSTEHQQIDWWAGTHSEKSGMRQGQAARHGYIVIAPKWQKPYQREYEFSLREHAAVLFCLRDACQRLAIDTDRVFLSGHSIGGDAVWDIALSHPDLWAGVIPIVANASRYVHKYSDNARGLPMYFVGGEKDNAWLNQNGMELDRYLKSGGCNVTVVQYLGRGHEHFQDEIQRIFDWMQLSAHRRRPFPTEIKALSMRPWDNYFWWLEIRDLPARSIALPAEGSERKVRPIQTEAELILENNRISVSARSDRGTVWLSPEMLSFEREITVMVNGRGIRWDGGVDIRTLLEDVRTRGDRQHPFWAKVEWPAK